MPISFKSLGATPAKWERTVFINSTQSWTAPADVTSVDVLLVGGGGGGGGAYNGEGSAGAGGGGGGVLQTPLAVTAGASYTVTIGAGGAGGNNTPSPGSHGSASSFGSLAISYGGGGAQATNGTAPAIPSDKIASTGGSGTGNSYVGGRGGGAGQNAVPYVYNNNVWYNDKADFIAQGTLGTRNVQSEIPANPGLNGFGAGGGGSIHGTNANNSIFGGLNAGNGGRYTVSAAQNGVANRGGGGGGASRNESGGSGGSGVCIIKYWSAL